MSSMDISRGVTLMFSIDFRNQFIRAMMQHALARCVSDDPVLVHAMIAVGVSQVKSAEAGDANECASQIEILLSFFLQRLRYCLYVLSLGRMLLD